jgi:hypothetical protein
MANITIETLKSIDCRLVQLKRCLDRRKIAFQINNAETCSFFSIYHSACLYHDHGNEYIVRACVRRGAILNDIGLHLGLQIVGDSLNPRLHCMNGRH